MHERVVQMLDKGLREDRPGQATTPTRRQRITLLLDSYGDALGAKGPDRESRPGKPESRFLEHSPLWREGSYRELDAALARLKIRAPKVYWHMTSYYVEGKSGKPVQRRKAALGVEFLKQTLPPFIQVPNEVLERGGFKAEKRRAAA